MEKLALLFCIACTCVVLSESKPFPREMNISVLRPSRPEKMTMLSDEDYDNSDYSGEDYTRVNRIGNGRRNINNVTIGARRRHQNWSKEDGNSRSRIRSEINYVGNGRGNDNTVRIEGKK